MTLHRLRSAAILAHSPPFSPVDSLMLVKQVLRCLPCGRVPCNLPSNAIVRMSPFLLICLKYLNFLCWMPAKSDLFVCKIFRTFSFEMRSYHLNFPILRRHHILNTSIFLSSTLLSVHASHL